MNGQLAIERELRELKCNLENIPLGSILSKHQSQASLPKSQYAKSRNNCQDMASPGRAFGNIYDLNASQSLLSSPSCVQSRVSGLKQKFASPTCNLPKLTQRDRQECSRSCSSPSPGRHDSIDEDELNSAADDLYSKSQRSPYGDEDVMNNQERLYDQEDYSEQDQFDTKSFLVLPQKSARNNDYCTNENSLCLEQGKYYIKTEQQVRTGKYSKNQINSFSTNILSESKNRSETKRDSNEERASKLTSPTKYIKSYLRTLRQRRVQDEKLRHFGATLISGATRQKIMEKIENRLVSTHALIKETYYKNSKHEQEQLMNTHDLQIKLREGLIKRVLEMQQDAKYK